MGLVTVKEIEDIIWNAEGLPIRSKYWVLSLATLIAVYVNSKAKSSATND